MLGAGLSCLLAGCSGGPARRDGEEHRPCAAPAMSDPPLGRPSWPVTQPPGVFAGRPLAVGPALFVATDDAALTRYDARTGVRAWRCDKVHPGTSDSSPLPLVSAGGVVVCGFSPTVEQTVLVGVCAEHGQVLWRHSVPNPAHLLTVHEGKVLAPIGDGVLAIDAADGRVLWKSPLAQPKELAVTPDGASVIAVSSLRNTIAAYALHDGSVRWTHALPDASDVSAVLGPGQVSTIAFTWNEAFTDGVTDIVTYEARTGRRMWSRHFSSPGTTSMTVIGDRLLCHVGGALLALRTSTGETAWRLPILTPNVEPHFRRQGDAVLVSTNTMREGLLFSVDPVAGRILWRKETKPFSGLSIPVDGVVFVEAGTDDNAVVVAVDASTGDVLWSENAEEGAWIVVGEGAVYAVGDREIVGFEAATGIRL
ncbi:hypothetical protein GCM10017673_11480 [Streptosporangium violaceochromogenes]|nr:hypothetical protein GCM10017673_11480 [Streptosporangium violaceochromogenes]